MAIDDRGAPPFKPVTATNTKQIAFLSSSVSAAVAIAFVPGQAVRIWNNTGVTQFIDFGAATLTAVITTGIPILNGTVEIMRVPDDAAYAFVASVPASSCTGTIYFTPGVGV